MRACWKRREDANNPLLERVKFLAIFASNLDEFFMVRVAGLREQAFGDMLPQDPPADGLKPLAQLQRIARRTEQLVAQQYGCWNESIVPALAEAGIRIHAMKDLDAKGAKSLDKYFRQAVFPVLTPMAIDPAHPSPRFHNRGLYLAAMLERVSGIGPQRLFAVVQVPQVLPRFVSRRAGRQAELRAARRPDRQPAAGSVRRLSHRRPCDVSAHARHGRQPAGAGSRRHAAVDRDRGCGRGSGPRRCGWRSRRA